MYRVDCLFLHIYGEFSVTVGFESAASHKIALFLPILFLYGSAYVCA